MPAAHRRKGGSGEQEEGSVIQQGCRGTIVPLHPVHKSTLSISQNPFYYLPSSMKDIAKNITTQVLVVILTIAGTTFVWYLWQRENRSLSLILNSTKTLISINKDRMDGLELKYRGNDIKSLSIVDISIENNGNTPIRKEDFSSPLNMKIDGNIVSLPEILHKKPKQLSPKIEVSEGAVQIIPMLLNPGDNFEFQLTILDLGSNLTEDSINGRIFGVKNIDFINKQKDKPTTDLVVLISTVIAALISSILNLFFVKTKFFTFLYNLIEVKLSYKTKQ
ncbi:hypothetical protein [Solidesulfovibrio sp. C21]|uniref:hypothetical protein n=1 Tax=Solidesulfovibrio sp. C21 TaxID=3398613 RepID=UPI0039FD9C91